MYGVVLCTLICYSTTHEGLGASSRGHLPIEKNNVTGKSPVGDISVVTLIRTDTTLDHSPKAEKVKRMATPTHTQPQKKQKQGKPTTVKTKWLGHCAGW